MLSVEKNPRDLIKGFDIAPPVPVLN